MNDFDFTSDNLQQTVNRIFIAEPDDISSDEAAILMAQLDPADFQDDPLTLSKLATISPKLWKHLQTCRDCLAEFQLLLPMLNGPVEETELQQIPVPRRPGKPTLGQRIGELVERIIQFPGFPTLDVAPTRGAQLNYDQVEIDLSLDFTLEIDPAIDSSDPSKRDIYLSLNGQDPDFEESDLEGTTIEILFADSNRTVGRAIFDDLGDATISGLEPDVSYDIRLRLADEIVRVRSLRLPNA